MQFIDTSAPRLVTKLTILCYDLQTMTRPKSDEFASYYSTYVDLVKSDEIVPAMREQMEQTLQFLARISEEQSLHSYAPGKWTIREVLNHMNDGERAFTGRAFWFARGFEDPLPSFDQNVAVEMAKANNTSWKQLVDEFRSLRQSTISLFETLPEEAWSRSGVASDNPVTVRALAYIIAGHVTHHVNVLSEKYL